MLFKAELAQKIVEGVKTQTRRPVKAGESLITVDGVKTVMGGSGKRIKWQVGREYRVQYGRGMPTRYFSPEGELPAVLLPYEKMCEAVSEYGQTILADMGFLPLKIRLIDIWAEDVRMISKDDAIAEGFEHPENTSIWGFLETWTGFYDKAANAFINQSDSITFGEFMRRPAELYLAWALKFEVVR